MNTPTLTAADLRLIVAALDYFSVESSLRDRVPYLPADGDHSSAPIVALANRLR